MIDYSHELHHHEFFLAKNMKHYENLLVKYLYEKKLRTTEFFLH